MDTVSLYRRAVEGWVGVVAGIPATAWSAPTPCAGWDVRTLVNHVVGEELWSVPLLDGKTLEEVGSRFDGDLLGDDPVTVSRQAAASSVAAVESRVAAGVRVHLSYGEEDAEEYTRQLAADHLVHGWDLAVACGTDATLDADLVHEVAAWFGDREELYRAAGVVGPARARPGDPQGDLLAAFGRDARWAATS